MVQAEGLEAVFECLYPGAIAYIWAINGTQQPGSVSSIFSVQASLEYNNSIFMCTASIKFGHQYYFFSSRNASLLVYGKPCDTCMYNKEVVTAQLNNATGIHARLDIASNILTLYLSDHNFTTEVHYYVDVHQANKNRDILSAYVNKTQYPFQYEDHTVCDRFSFTITPTEMGRNGTSSQPVFGHFTQARGTVCFVLKLE